jgi:hypothetical protein
MSDPVNSQSQSQSPAGSILNSGSRYRNARNAAGAGSGGAGSDGVPYSGSRQNSSQLNSDSAQTGTPSSQPRKAGRGGGGGGSGGSPPSSLSGPTSGRSPRLPLQSPRAMLQSDGVGTGNSGAGGPGSGSRGADAELWGTNILVSEVMKRFSTFLKEFREPVSDELLYHRMVTEARRRVDAIIEPTIANSETELSISDACTYLVLGKIQNICLTANFIVSSASHCMHSVTSGCCR